jgi:maleate isomerase
MSRAIRIGVLTPSSNTVLEPMMSRMLSGMPEVSVHFARFAVTQIALSTPALAQFDTGGIVEAARLLGHARPDVICWNGTAAGWLGFDADARLCALITEATGVPACTSVLALNELLAARSARTFGLVSPYTEDVQARIIGNYRASGFECVIERHLGLSNNFSFSEVSEIQLRDMVMRTAQARPDAILVYCTNLRAAHCVAAWESEGGIPVYDTIATVVWKALRIVGLPPCRVVGWGSLFKDID